MNFLTGTQSLNGGRAETNMSQNNSFWGFPPINELRCTFIQTPSSNENTYLRHVRSLRRSQRYLLAFGLGFAFFFFSFPFRFWLDLPSFMAFKVAFYWADGVRTSHFICRLAFINVFPSSSRSLPLWLEWGLWLLIWKSCFDKLKEPWWQRGTELGFRSGVQAPCFQDVGEGKKSENKYASWLKSKAKKTTRKSAPGWLKPPLWRTGCTANRLQVLKERKPYYRCLRLQEIAPALITWDTNHTHQKLKNSIKKKCVSTTLL